MYITEVELEDLKCFRGRHHISLDRGSEDYAGWTVFAGRNGSGKSSLLKAITMSVLGPRASIALEGAFSGWVRRGAEQATISTCIQPNRKLDRFQEVGRTIKSAFWTGLVWEPQSGGHESVNSWLELASSSRKKTPERGPWADSSQGWFIAAYGPFRHLGPANADTIRLTRDPRLAQVVNLFHEAASLTDAVEWLQQIHLRALEGQDEAKRLKEAALQLLNDGLLPDGSTVERVSSEGLWVKRDGVTMPVTSISDGYRTVVALVLDIVRLLHATYTGELSFDADLACSLHGVVLIDEIDAHMHISWQQRIGGWLCRHFPNIQFLVTTHSPFICQAASPKGIIRLPAPGETRTLEHVSEPLFRAITRGSVDDAVMSELFGLEHAHSAESEQLRAELATLEGKLLRGHPLTENQKLRLQVIRQQLPDTLSDFTDQKFRAVQSAP